jgi:hypothetical protein
VCTTSSSITELHPALAEHETGIYSEVQSVFKSLCCTATVKSLPAAVYMAFINFITSPDQHFISAVLERSIQEIESSLITVFNYAGAHRLF